MTIILGEIETENSSEYKSKSRKCKILNSQLKKQTHGWSDKACNMQHNGFCNSNKKNAKC